MTIDAMGKQRKAILPRASSPAPICSGIFSLSRFSFLVVLLFPSYHFLVLAMDGRVL